MCIACNPGITRLLNQMVSRRTVLGGALAFSASAWLPKTVAQNRYAEVIFRNGTVITMDPARPRAEAVAVSGGKILAEGSESDLEGLKNSKTQLVDLAGGTLLPGLIDPHMHTTFVAFESWLDVGPFKMARVDEAVEALREAAAKAAPGEWVKGWQFDASIMPGTTKIDLALLDRIAPENPLILYESNGHIAHVNSKALAQVGVTRDTPDPPQGKYQRDHNGDLTGRLVETPAILPFMAKVGLPTAEEMEATIERLFRRAASRGCTGLYDCGIGLTGPGDLAIIQNVMMRDQPVRFGGTLVSTHMKAWRGRRTEARFRQRPVPAKRNQGLVRWLQPRPERLSARALSQLGQSRKFELHARTTDRSHSPSASGWLERLRPCQW